MSMGRDFGPIFEGFAELDDAELLRRLRTMENQISYEPLSRLAAVSNSIGPLQTILSRAEDDGERSEQTLDEIREILERLRSTVAPNLEQARRNFEHAHQEVTKRGLFEQAVQAQAAIDQIAEMQQTERANPATLVELDDLYGKLLSSYVFDR